MEIHFWLDFETLHCNYTMSLFSYSAIFVENENGKKTVLSETDAKQRHAVAKRLLTPSDNSKSIVQTCKKVYRHIYNGDVVLLNRQPTLHRPSIMAHKVIPNMFL